MGPDNGATTIVLANQWLLWGGHRHLEVQVIRSLLFVKRMRRRCVGLQPDAVAIQNVAVERESTAERKQESIRLKDEFLAIFPMNAHSVDRYSGWSRCSRLLDNYPIAARAIERQTDRHHPVEKTMTFSTFSRIITGTHLDLHPIDLTPY